MISVDAGFLGEFLPPDADVLIFYDGPRCWAFSHNNRWFYVHQADESLEYWDFWVRETNKSEINKLKHGKIGLREFLFEAKPLYFVREYYRAFNGHLPGNLQAYIVNYHDYPQDFFPQPNVFLNSRN